MAQIRTILEVNDFTFHLITAVNIGPSISRAEIEAIHVENSRALPVVNHVVMIDNTNRFFRCLYDASLDQWTAEELTVAA